VQNDIDLSRERPVLVISGPNAGGKTVILKTVGLLCLMAQAGIPVTAAEGSEVPVLGDVFADIGDEQDIEQDLSTFSSHVSRIAEILREAGRDSLVLLDELGSGTDPAEGGAFGAAVLDRLLERRCITVVTTHHSGLKLFGSRTAGAVNAAMEFDPETLEPTYRFIPGRPGRSYGLDMAARLGIPPGVIDEARAKMSSDESGLDRLLEQVEEDARRLRQEREQAEADRQAARRLREEAEAQTKAATEEARNARIKAKSESREVLVMLRQRLKDLSRAAALGRDEAKAARQEIDALVRKLEPAEPEQEALSAVPAVFQPGDRVRLPGLNKTGTVVFVHKDALEVDTGAIKLRVPSRTVVPIDEVRAEGRPAVSGWSADLEELEGIPDRLNLLGMRVDEAVEAVDRFIDRAGLRGFHQVTVIHGLGTGALKEAVAAFLKGHPLVASLRPGEPAEGGAGVTVAELKK
jgi:DNA mismatch repair protein MutS2